MVKGLRKKGSVIKPALFQPLALLEMVVTHKEKASLQSIKEIKSAHIYRSLLDNIKKSSAIMFLNELIYKTINEEEENKGLFGFLFESLKWYDDYDGHLPHYHLFFSIRLSSFLGFSPEGRPRSETDVFDLFEGSFMPDPWIDSRNQIKGRAAEMFYSLGQCKIEELENITIPSETRRELLEKIIQYYQYHVPTVKEMKSPAILHEVLR
jgi:DNA repair protein RecO (recombination protein O)